MSRRSYMVKIKTALVGRLSLLRKYLGCSPSWACCLPWLLAGLVKVRVLPGQKVGMLELALAADKTQRITLDASSPAEIDVFDEVMVSRIYPFDRLPFIPSLVADCGANIGYFSSLARVAFPNAEIFAWEPDARNFRRLAEQPILRNAATTLANQAVSDCRGRVSLTGTGHGCEIQGTLTGNEGVECVDFSAWWREHVMSHALLKMDIEGHETTVLPTLRGSWKAPCAVFLETHAPRGADGELIGQLESDGFRIEKLRAHSLPDDDRVFQEYLAVLS